MTSVPFLLGIIVDYFQPQSNVTDTQVCVTSAGIVVIGACAYLGISQQNHLFEHILVKVKAAVNILLYNHVSIRNNLIRICITSRRIEYFYKQYVLKQPSSCFLFSWTKGSSYLVLDIEVNQTNSF